MRVFKYHERGSSCRDSRKNQETRKRSPCQADVDNYRHTERNKKKSVLSLANRLVEKYNMPEERGTNLLFDINSSPAKNIQPRMIIYKTTACKGHLKQR